MGKKHIWIIYENASSPKYEVEFSYYYLAKEFFENDY